MSCLPPLTLSQAMDWFASSGAFRIDDVHVNLTGNAGNDDDAIELQIKGQADAGSRGACDASKPPKRNFAAAQNLFLTGHRHEDLSAKSISQSNV